jgi:hypothetical protein
MKSYKKNQIKTSYKQHLIKKSYLNCCQAIMAVVGGLIMWAVLIALTVGYVVVKKYGDKK